MDIDGVKTKRGTLPKVGRSRETPAGAPLLQGPQTSAILFLSIWVRLFLPEGFVGTNILSHWGMYSLPSLVKQKTPPPFRQCDLGMQNGSR